MAWYLAQSLVQLRNEVNRKWPNRSKISDGAIGDQEHASRASDHNMDSKGCVHAWDCTAPNTINVNELLRAVISDPRVNYIIYNRRIWDRSNGFAARAYTGVSPHTEHVHISVNRDHTSETNTTTWFSSSKSNVRLPPTRNTTTGAFLMTLGTAKENQVYSWTSTLPHQFGSLVDKVNRSGTAAAAHAEETERKLAMLEDKINRTGNAVAALNAKLDQILAAVNAK